MEVEFAQFLPLGFQTIESVSPDCPSPTGVASSIDRCHTAHFMGWNHGSILDGQLPTRTIRLDIDYAAFLWLIRPTHEVLRLSIGNEPANLDGRDRGRSAVQLFSI